MLRCSSKYREYTTEEIPIGTVYEIFIHVGSHLKKGTEKYGTS